MRRKVEAIIVRATLAVVLLAVSFSVHAQNDEPKTDQLISRSFRVDIVPLENSFSPFAFRRDAQKPKVLLEDSATRLTDQLRAIFAAAGVQLEDVLTTASRPNQKAMFLNDRTGLLIVRATATELAKIENVLASLPSQPEITIETKFVEIPYTSQSTAPEDPMSQQQRASTNVTVTILTEKQARVALRQYETTEGVDVITPPHVTTISGRQARIQTEPTTRFRKIPPQTPTQLRTTKVACHFRRCSGQIAWGARFS